MSADFDYTGDPDFLPTVKELQKKIEFKEELKGKGSNGTLIRGRNKLLDREVVVKFYYWEKGTYVEPKRLAIFDHQNILKVYDAEPIDDQHAYYITEYCENGDLDDLISTRRLSVHEALDMVRQVALGVAQMHASSLVHRDLKPQNIYLDKAGAARIGDFGSVIDLGPEQSKKSHTNHSLLYRPPEAFDQVYYRQSDIYQLGLLCFQLLGGHFSYDPLSYLKVPDQKKYNECETDWDRSAVVDQAIKSLVNKQRLINLDHLPSWAQQHRIKRLVKKAMSPSIADRHHSISDFLTDVSGTRAICHDWKPSADYVELQLKPTAYRVSLNSPIYVQKRRNGAEWRQDRTFAGANIASALEHVITASKK